MPKISYFHPGLIGICGGAGAAGYYAWINRGMWIEMQKQSNIASDQLEQTQRPWIVIENVSVPKYQVLRLSKSTFAGISTALQLDTKNIGHSPAVNVGIFPVLVCCNSLAEGTVKNICESNGYRDGLGETVFPDGKGPETAYALQLSNADTAKYWNFAPGQRNLMVIGCVVYRSTTSRGFYYTGFSYSLSTAANITPEATEVPANALHFQDLFGIVVK